VPLATPVMRHVACAASLRASLKERRYGYPKRLSLTEPAVLSLQSPSAFLADNFSVFALSPLDLGPPAGSATRTRV